jgi:hypothetical protein
MAGGVTADRLLEDYPYLETEDIAAALEFAALQSDNPIIKPSGPCASWSERQYLLYAKASGRLLTTSGEGQTLFERSS